MTQRRVSVTPHRDCLVFHLVGDFDMAGHELLQTAWHGLLNEAPVPALLDLTEVTFLDCGSARIVTEIAQLRDPELPIVCPEGPALRVMRLSGYVDEHLVLPTLAAGFAVLTNPGAARRPRRRDPHRSTPRP